MVFQGFDLKFQAEFQWVFDNAASVGVWEAVDGMLDDSAVTCVRSCW